MATAAHGPSAEDELPAPLQGIISLLEPGTRPIVFTFFKAVTVALVLCVAGMLATLDVGPDVAIHLKVFLGLSVVLMVITIWFFGELQNAQAAQAAEKAGDSKKDK